MNYEGSQLLSTVVKRMLVNRLRRKVVLCRHQRCRSYGLRPTPAGYRFGDQQTPSGSRQYVRALEPHPTLFIKGHKNLPLYTTLRRFIIRQGKSRSESLHLAGCYQSLTDCPGPCSPNCQESDHSGILVEFSFLIKSCLPLVSTKISPSVLVPVDITVGLRGDD